MGLVLAGIAGVAMSMGAWLFGGGLLVLAYVTTRYEDNTPVWMLNKYYIRESSDGLRYDVVCKETGLIWFTGNRVEVCDELERLENRS